MPLTLAPHLSPLPQPLSLEEFATLFFALDINHTPKSHYVVAVSGGADSLALCLLLSAFLQKQGGQLTALTVNHHLRPEAHSEALSVGKLLHTQNINHHILDWHHAPLHAAIQEQARQARYDLLETWCAQHQVTYLFVAQHFDDQAETFFMRLAKKSSLIGLAGMRPVTRRQRCWIARPLLSVPKARLEATLKQAGIEWIQDPSNENRAYERVFYRMQGVNRVFSVSLHQRLLRTRQSLEGWVQRWLKRYGQEFPLGYALLNLDALTLLPAFFKETILSYVLRAYGVGRYPPKTAVIQKLARHINATDFKPTTAQGLRLAKAQGNLLIHREYRAIKEVFLTDGFDSGLWDQRFGIQLLSKGVNEIRAIGSQGWHQLLENYPDLKAITVPRPVLWSLPGVWHNQTLDLENNMIAQEFLTPKYPCSATKFKFLAKYPF